MWAVIAWHITYTPCIGLALDVCIIFTLFASIILIGVAHRYKLPQIFNLDYPVRPQCCAVVRDFSCHCKCKDVTWFVHWFLCKNNNHFQVLVYGPTNHLRNGSLKHHAHPGLIKQGFLFQNMMTSSNGNIFRVTGPLCGEFTGPGEFPTQRPMTRSFDVFLDLRLNKRLNKQSWCWWFETLSRPFWRHRNDNTTKATQYRKTSSISRTKFPNLNVPCILLQLSSLNPLKPGVKLRMKM